jgi:hypothetical protein
MLISKGPAFGHTKFRRSRTVNPSAAGDNIQEVAMDMLFRTLPFRSGLAVGALAGVMLIGSSGAVLADAPPGDFTTILNAHNAYRSQHCAAPLAWSDELAAAAQQWANACTLDANGRFAHDDNRGEVGENLHWGTQTTAQGAVDSWYSEINNYDFDNPVYSSAVGHFTQVVWRGSTQLGCGVAACGDVKLWVCRYSPPGNWNVNQPGVLAANVQRNCGDMLPPPPEATLKSLHPGCDDESKSQTPDCVAAIHRFCENSVKGAGISQEVGSNVFGVACFTPTSYGDVSLTELAGQHPGCNAESLSRSPDCVSAIHRVCAASSPGGAGVSQEVGAGVLGVACFTPSWYGDVSLDALSSKHPGCNGLEKSQQGECMAAVHRWCADSGLGGAGLVQEVGNGVFGVACFQPSSYGDVKIR